MDYSPQKYERRDRFPHIPFAIEEMEMAPNFMEVIGWIFMAFCVGDLFIGFLGL